MEESAMEQSLELYRAQVSQVDQAIQAAGETEDLVKLKEDLTELISLTEESLLSVKKNKLLASLQTPPDASSSTQSKNNSDNLDDEYAAFQACLGGDAFENAKPESSSQDAENQEEDSEEEDEEENISAADSFSELVGMKCQAPFSHDWGGHAHHNALVFQVEDSSNGTEMPKVRVMFCNPTHVSMVPCKFFLDGRCRFTEDKCKYSHGYLVNIEDLQEYKDPDYSHVVVGGKCFARYSDDVWHEATVLDIVDDQVTVTFTSHGNTESIDMHHILPLEQHEDSSESSDEDPSGSPQPISREESDSDDDLPVFLWKPPKTFQPMGEWEQHTRGIASKLMTKMGYIAGQGLGVRGEGRAEPVPIQLLPQGKSLDKIMELKEIAGDQNLFDALKKLKKKKKKEEKKQSSSTTVNQEKPNVFDFINKKLRGKKGNLHDLVSHQSESSKSPPSKHISESDLHQKTDRHINIQALKTSEEIRKVEKELKHLQKSLSRNQDRDKSMASQVRQKISSAEAYLEKLRASEKTLETHKERRKDHKKLTIF